MKVKKMYKKRLLSTYRRFIDLLPLYRKCKSKTIAPALIPSLSFYIFIACCIALPSLTFAAAPVTHVVLAEKWMEHQEHYTEEQKSSFILGTLFPDIRYLGVISRAKTHERGLTLEHLLESQSEFNKGKRLHAFVDRQREKLVMKWKIYDRIKHVPGQRYKTTFLKLLEDEILFSTRSWGNIRQYLKTIHHEEREYEIQDKDIERWHTQLNRSFLAPPSIYLMTLSLLNRGYGHVPAEIIKEWNQLLPELAKDKCMQEYVEALLAEFDKIFNPQPKIQPDSKPAN